MWTEFYLFTFVVNWFKSTCQIKTSASVTFCANHFRRNGVDIVGEIRDWVIANFSFILYEWSKNFPWRRLRLFRSLVSQINKTQIYKINNFLMSNSAPKIANIFPGIILWHQILVGTHSHNCVHGWRQWATADIKMRQDWRCNFFCKSFLQTIVA